MKNFDFLSKTEIEKASKKYRRNPYVKETFEMYINNPNLKINKRSDKNRIDAFERILGKARTITRRITAFGRYKTGYQFSEFMTMLVKEDILYRSSFLNSFEKAKGKDIAERFTNSEKLNFFGRTKEFRKKYGDEMMQYGNENKPLKQYFEDYKKGKISQERLNFIIYDFKDLNPEYLSQDYKANNYESKEATLEDYGFEK